jgi:hypothetical protein
MPTTKNTKRSGTAEDPAAANSHKRRPNLKNDRKLVDSLVGGMYEEVRDKQRPVADLIKLLQFRRELTKDAGVRRIEVQWVEPSSKEPVSST